MEKIQRLVCFEVSQLCQKTISKIFRCIQKGIAAWDNNGWTKTFWNQLMKERGDFNKTKHWFKNIYGISCWLFVINIDATDWENRKECGVWKLSKSRIEDCEGGARNPEWVCANYAYPGGSWQLSWDAT